jgi:predicted DNA repair protein MutK
MAVGLLALLDDIASVLDDVALMSKVAAKKTAGVLGDDLALNAQQVSGVNADRELPVVWAVARGSFVNKAILVPAALAISAFLPQAITPLMMVGGAYLCFEGFEKLAHKFMHSGDEDAAHEAELVAALAANTDMRAVEKDKIKGAVRTDFILSAEIIVISLGVVNAGNVSFGAQVGALVAVAIVMTIGVYGLVAGIVKIDDAGLWLSKRSGGAARALGKFLLAMAPRLMKTLTVVGTAAMFMVGGGIIAHAVEPLHHLSEAAAHAVSGVPLLGGLLAAIAPVVVDAVAGVVIGAVVVLAVTLVQRLRGKGGKQQPLKAKH